MVIFLFPYYLFVSMVASSNLQIVLTINLFLLLFLCLVNDTEVGPLQTVDISNPDTTKWVMRDLEPVSKYKFYLRSCTTVGCGPVVSVECTTTLQTSE